MRVSVIITVYNVERYIERCISSILNQTYKDFELLVVNDGTPDRSMAIAENFASNDKRIRIVNHGDNVGLMCARRRGYVEAKGDYIFFVDSDDTLPENALESLVRAAETTGADIVAGWGIHYLANGTTKDMSVSLPYGNDSHGLYKALTHYEFSHYVWGKLYKRELLQGYNYKYVNGLTNAEDYLLFYQLAKNVNHVECINETVYNYYQHVESSSQVHLSEWQLESNIIAYSYVLKELAKDKSLKKDIYASTQRALARFYAKGYNITELLKKHDSLDILSFENIMKYNGVMDAMVCMIGKSKIGKSIFKYWHK